MRLACHLRTIRGKRSLSEIQEASGIHRGTLSKLEHGRLLPSDKELPRLELAYGAPITDWYEPRALLALQEDEAA